MSQRRPGVDDQLCVGVVDDAVDGQIHLIGGWWREQLVVRSADGRECFARAPRANLQHDVRGGDCQDVAFGVDQLDSFEAQLERAGRFRIQLDHA